MVVETHWPGHKKAHSQASLIHACASFLFWVNKQKKMNPRDYFSSWLNYLSSILNLETYLVGLVDLLPCVLRWSFEVWIKLPFKAVLLLLLTAKQSDLFDSISIVYHSHTIIWYHTCMESFTHLCNYFPDCKSLRKSSLSTNTYHYKIKHTKTKYCLIAD